MSKQRQEKNVPQLRFPEFEGEWENYKLSDLLEFKNGINAKKEDYGSGYKFINVLDIIENDFITHDVIRGQVNITQKQFQESIVEYGDILFQRSSETREEVGQSNVYLDKERAATFGGFVIRGKKIKEYNPQLLNFLLKTSNARKEITSKSGGSTRYNLSQSTLSEVSIQIPKLQEQQKIATFLSAIDRRIELLQRKKEQLELYKKGVMQQLFNQEIRFKDEDGKDFPEWEEKRLGDVFTFQKGKGVSKSDIKESGKIKCIRYGELYTTYNEVIDKVESKTDLNPKALVLSKGNEILIPASGESAIDIATASCVTVPEVALGGDLNILSGEENGVFMAYYMSNKLKNRIARISQGISVIHLYASQLKQLKIQIACKKEQKAIADFLISIDNKINDLADVSDSVKDYKKSLLQKMFI